MTSSINAWLLDVRYSLRALLSRPGITAVAVATLAIGTGAATTTFAVVDSILLEPLAYPDADELVSIWHDAPGADLPIGPGGLPSSASMFFTYGVENRVFEHIGLWTPGVATITGHGEPEEVPRIAVTAGLLEALGVAPQLGRWFAAGELAPGAAATVILSHGYWQRRFGGDASVLGRTLEVNGQPVEILGVMPPGFRIADTEADLLMGPMRFDRSALFLPPFSYRATARLKPGLTVADANADIARMLPIWERSWPAPGVDARLYTDVWRIGPAARSLKQDVVGNVGSVLKIVVAMIGVLLAIATANVANLMLMRGASRQHELAIRAALGAGVARLRRASLIESAAVGALGGLAGLAIAWAGLSALAYLGPSTLPRLGEVALDGDVIAISLAVTLLAGAFVGLVVASKIDSGRVYDGLHAGGRTSSGGRGQQRTQRSLVVAQVALAVVVLVCAGLSIRTVAALRSVTPGFSGAGHVQTLRISMRVGQVPDPVLVARRQHAILDALTALPSVTAVGLASSMPMDGFNALGDSVEVEGGPREPVLRRFKRVSPGLFAAIGTPLLAGRDYTWADLYEYRPVVMISESMARELWARPEAAIGKRIRLYENDRWHEVVGVVADVREDGLRAAAPQIVYWPTLRTEGISPAGDGLDAVSRSVVIAVRSSRAGTDAFNSEIQTAVWSIDPNLPVTWVRTLADIYDESLARTTFTVVTLAVAACAALALGLVGLYGVLAYAVALRRREIAIRLALGAQPREVRGLFVRSGVVLAVFGSAVGLAAAAGVTRLMGSVLYEVEPLDPLTYFAVAVVLIVIAALASYLPARRASAVDPAESLAAE